MVYAIAGLGLRGLDLEAVLLGGGREEAPNRMFLPIRGFHDLGNGRPFGPPDQFQNPCALPLGARLAGFLSMGGFGSLLADRGFLFRAALALPLAAVWPLGAPFFGVARFFEEAFSGAPCAPRLDVRANLDAAVAALAL